MGGGLDLDDVATFVRVAEDASFTAAARALGVPKSTVSRALTRLERALGVRLVQRTTRAVALTDAGRAYLERVRGAVASIAAASADVVDLGAEPRGTIRITAPVDVGELLLADVIARFVQRHPQVRFEVALTSRVVDLVAEGFDLAVRASSMPDSSLVARRLGAADLGLFASEAYLRRRGAPAAVADLAAHDVIGFRPAGVAQAPLVLTGPRGQEPVTVHGPVDADDLLFVRRLVAAGAGIGLLPLFLLGARRARGARGAADDGERLERVLPDWALRGAALAVIAPSARHEPQRVRAFRDFLLAESRRAGFGAR